MNTEEHFFCVLFICAFGAGTPALLGTLASAGFTGASAGGNAYKYALSKGYGEEASDQAGHSSCLVFLRRASSLSVAYIQRYKLLPPPCRAQKSSSHAETLHGSDASLRFREELCRPGGLFRRGAAIRAGRHPRDFFQRAGRPAEDLHRQYRQRTSSRGRQCGRPDGGGRL